jgi:hypothetical protein
VNDALQQAQPRYDDQNAWLAAVAGLQSLLQSLDAWVPPPLDAPQPPVAEDPPLLALLGLLALREPLRPLLDTPPLPDAPAPHPMVLPPMRSLLR